jgi:hypothetical protein
MSGNTHPILQPRSDFLKQPGVAVGVIECGKGKIAAVIWPQAADATVAVGPELPES